MAKLRQPRVRGDNTSYPDRLCDFKNGGYRIVKSNDKYAKAVGIHDSVGRIEFNALRKRLGASTVKCKSQILE
ncbi:hypothetical protein EVAR_57588_1 [Eumeta japonica]|uniref:Uncharacterized protein n=1 Tax=Eumeta variegata TaxID=151549 RepID=A0A4C1Z3Y7_EUMVA|nr:hypothetical protein EVAR_57588_1 [Eumeta japonica]